MVWFSIDNEKDIKNLNFKLNNSNYDKMKNIKNKFKKMKISGKIKKYLLQDIQVLKEVG